MSDRIFSIGVRAIAGCAAMALAIAPISAQPAPPVVGVNAAIHNVVQLRRGGQPLRPAVLRERVVLNDQINTGAASQLQILLLDRSTFTVGANARVAIDRFVYDPARNTRATAVSVTRGAFRFMSGRKTGRPAGPATVRTPTASIGIRGTIFEGVVGADAVAIAMNEPAVGADIQADMDQATLIVLRGPGQRTQGDESPGAIDVTAGDRVIVLDRPALALYIPRAGAAPIGPFEITPQGLQALSSLLRPLPSFAPSTLLAGGRSEAAGGPGPSDSGTGQSGDSTGAESGTMGAGGSSTSGSDAGKGSGRGDILMFAGIGGLAALAALILSSGDDGDPQPITPRTAPRAPDPVALQGLRGRYIVSGGMI